MGLYVVVLRDHSVLINGLLGDNELHAEAALCQKRYYIIKYRDGRHDGSV